MTDFIIGLDLGQAQDYAAIAGAEVVPPERRVPMVHPEDVIQPSPGMVRSLPPRVPSKRTYRVRGLERPPLGTPYPAILERLRELVRDKRLGCTGLVVDATGVGPPVVDLLRQAGLHPVAVTITGGDTVTKEDWLTWRVPKRDLASTVKVLLQSHRLQIADGLEHGPTLARELLNFRAKINLRTMHDSYEAWREGMHDDLVLAVAVACWWDGKRRGPLPQVRVRIMRRYAGEATRLLGKLG